MLSIPSLYFSDIKNQMVVKAWQVAYDKFNVDYTLTYDGPTDMINIAKKQSGRTGASFEYGDEWCALFVSDCAVLAGQSKAIPSNAGCYSMQNAVINAGGWYISLSEAQPGDLVFFSSSKYPNGGAHVEIVVSGTGNNIYSIGGNTGEGDSWKTRVVCSPRIHGNPYCIIRPNYDGSGTYVPPEPDGELGIPYPRPSGSPYLQTGSKGNYVGWVQVALNRAINAGLTIDCDFGTATYNAVRAFQSTYGLEVDGVVGSDTINKLVSVLLDMMKPKTCIVSFNANGGSCGTGEKAVTIGSSYGDLPDASRTGYSFAGWFDENGSNISSGSYVSRSDNHTLYAHWNQNQYTVWFDGNGGDADWNSKTVVYDGTYGDLPNAGRTGYTFAGWFDEWGNGISSNTAMTRADNHTLYAYWNQNQYTIYFNGNGGNVDLGNKNVTYDGTYGDFPNAERTGYTFTGWSDEWGNSISSDTAMTRADNHTLYAHWQANPVTVWLNPNNGEVSQENIQFFYEQNYTDLPQAVRTGYNFNGWYTAADGGALVDANTIVSQTEEHTLYAHWSKDKFLITFDARGGTSEAASKLVAYDNLYGVLPSAEKSGYIFEGWYFDEQCTIPLTSDTVVQITANQTFYAKWALKQYLLTFDANGGSADAQNKKVTFGKNYGVLPVPEKSGCQFAGWFTEAGIEITSDSIVQIDSDMTVAAKWLIYGDINANHDIDVRDLVILQRYLHNKRKFSETEFYVSDLNQDGIVNVFDLALLKRILIKK